MAETETEVMNQKSMVERQWLATEVEESLKIEEMVNKQKKFNHLENIVWRNVIIFAVLHSIAIIGLYHLIFVAKWLTVIWMFLSGFSGGVGITAGPHRLWAHKSYKAKFPLRLILVIMNCISFQNSIIEWVRDHQAHHKWSDTDADPHNIKRGFFFAHMGWLMSRKHPMVKEMGKKLDLTDLYSDPLLVFQQRYYVPLAILFSLMLPAFIPVYFWKESPWVAYTTASGLRYCLSLHATWFINSAAHTYGYRPYDANIAPTENVITTLIALGEGGHNYHHTFPQDYRTSEYTDLCNFTKSFIDFFAKLGWAYDLRVVGKDSINRQIERQLDCTPKKQEHNE